MPETMMRILSLLGRAVRELWLPTLVILATALIGYVVGWRDGCRQGEKDKTEQLKRMLEGMKIKPWDEL